MKVTERTRRALAARRDRRQKLRDGWEEVEAPWQILRGLGRSHQVVTQVAIGVGGKTIWCKTGNPK